MIPKIVHRIWLGGMPLPERYAAFGESFRRHNPDWEFCVWTEAELAREGFIARAVANGGRGAVVNGGCVGFNGLSNVYRLEILLRYGGVYVDTDVECVRPLDRLLMRGGTPLEAFCGWQKPKKSVCNAVVGAAPGSAWVKQMLDSVPRYWKLKPPWGPRHMTENLRPGVFIYAKDVFYPFAFDEPPCEPKPETHMIHYWDKTWDVG